MTDPLNAQMAREDLQYIRQTLQAAGQFTAVPGKSLMLAGVMALAGVACNLLLTGAPWSGGPTSGFPRPRSTSGSPSAAAAATRANKAVKYCSGSR